MIIKVLASPSSDLVKILQFASDVYYNGEDSVSRNKLADMRGLRDKLCNRYLGKPCGRNVPFMTDAEWDSLYDKLRELDPHNSFFEKVGAPIKKMKVKLPFMMPSLNKVKPHTGTVPQWIAKHSGPWMVSEKADGVSILLVKEERTQAFTRGDGMYGGDISFMVPHFRMPKMKEGEAFRGEIIMSQERFRSKWAQEFKNARNMAAGITNRSDVHKAIRDMDILIYEVLNPRGVPSQQLAKLKARGFKVVPFKVYDEIDETKLEELLAVRRAKSPYELDGLVITQDRKNPLAKTNPDWSVAFKSDALDEARISEVVEVQWNPTRTGYLFPRLVIKPVNIRGVTVKHVSGKSAAFIRDNKIGPGAHIKVRRSGDVIPDIRPQDVVRPANRGAMPSGSDWEWIGENIRMSGTKAEKLSTVKAKNIQFFFASIGVERFKEATIQKFIDQGIDSVSKILKLPRTQFINIPGGSIILKDVYDQIQDAINDIELPTLMAASQVFGRSFGERRAAAILKAYPNVLDYAGKPTSFVTNLVADIPGFNTITAEQFATNLPVFVKWLRFVPSIRWTLPKKAKVKSDKLAGQSVLFTGFRDSDLESLIQENGGNVASSIGNATILLAKDPGGSSAKLMAARERGVKIMTADEFKRRYKL